MTSVLSQICATRSREPVFCSLAKRIKTFLHLSSEVMQTRDRGRSLKRGKSSLLESIIWRNSLQGTPLSYLYKEVSGVISVANVPDCCSTVVGDAEDCFVLLVGTGTRSVAFLGLVLVLSLIVS
jgi:hypothetical protein